MMRQWALLAVICVIVQTSLGCGPQPTRSLRPTAEPTVALPTAGGAVVLSEVSDDPVLKHKTYQPLADYLAARLRDADLGIATARVKISPDLESAAQLMRSGELDLYFDSPYPAMIVSSLSGAQPILRRWKGGDAEYSSVLITRADSGITALTDLNGRIIGLENTYSTSGYLLPATYLAIAGLSLHERPDLSAGAEPGAVGYVFTRDEKNTIQWVLSNRVAAGAIDRRSFLKIPDEGRAELAVLAETEKVIRHVVLARPGLDPALLDAIKTILISMEASPEGQAVLTQFEMTARFDEIPTEATLSRMRQLVEMMPRR